MFNDEGMNTKEAQEWSEEELLYADFGDKRLEDRFIKLLKSLGDNPSGNIPSCCNGWSETMAGYRFFQNEKVTSEKVLESHRRRTIERIQKHDVVLIVQDTSNLSYTKKKEKIKNLGYIDSPNDYGMLLHPTIAFTPEGLCLGVTTMQTIIRDINNFGRSHESKPFNTPIEKRESYRWLEGYREAARIQEETSDTQVIMVGDREADIYEIYEEASICQTNWIIRARHNRRLEARKNWPKEERLFDKIKRLTPIGTIEYKLPAREKRKARQVTLEIRASSKTITPPLNSQKLGYGSHQINFLLLEESNPPKGEKPISWRLVTSLPVDSLENAQKVVQYYIARWGIECFFRVLKTGCAVEELQLQDYDHLAPCIALYLIVAWRVMFLTHLGRRCPDIPCNSVFLDAEWQAAYIVAYQKKPPKRPPTLYEMICLIATFGGYLNRKGDPPPGSQSLWIGIQRTKDFTLAHLAMRNITINE